MVDQGDPQNARPAHPASDGVRRLEALKKRYDIVKWIAGVGIGLAVGAFAVGAYFRDVASYIDNYTTPPGMIAFFKSRECPRNWQRVDELRGRYIVGADPNHVDDVGSAIGIALDSGENRPAGKHTHGYVNTVPVANGGRDRMMGGGGGGFSDPTRDTDGGVDGARGQLKEGTNAPYLILTACSSPHP